jgi:hypothetical protein
MALDPSLSEAVIRRSVRKYFVDTYFTGLSIDIFFDKIGRVPKITDVEINRWMSVHLDSFDNQTMSSGFLQVWLYTRRDTDFTDLAVLRDMVYEHLIDLTQTDGIKRIALYDASWAIVGWALLMPQTDWGPEEIEDGTNAKILPVTLRWGAK